MQSNMKINRNILLAGAILLLLVAVIWGFLMENYLVTVSPCTAAFTLLIFGSSIED